MRTACPTTLLAALLLVSCSSSLDAQLRKRVSGNLVFWDQGRGVESILANADLFSEISPFWYRVIADGRVVPYTTASGSTYEDPTLLAFLRANGILVIPTVANIIDGVWDGALVSRILRDPVLRQANIAALVQLAVDKRYDGIDLDYEDLPASDRSAFSGFVGQLAAALHAQRKLLTVNVYAKTAEPGTWSGPQSQDWSAIGQAADQVRIMAYEYHWSGSGPGPVAPIAWVRDVLAFARTIIPADRIVHGLPLYGYDWVGQSGVDLVWSDATELASRHGAAVRWDSASASPWFEYTVSRVRHTTWFENATSTDAKLQASGAYGVGGVALWRLGGEDPGTWSAVRARLGGNGGAPDDVPPAVAIIPPRDGATVSKNQTIQVAATDDTVVARVEFFVDEVSIGSDASAPYALSWNTRRASRGTHVVKAVAYDRAGNSSTDRVTVYK